MTPVLSVTLRLDDLADILSKMIAELGLNEKVPFQTYQHYVHRLSLLQPEYQWLSSLKTPITKPMEIGILIVDSIVSLLGTEKFFKNVVFEQKLPTQLAEQTSKE